LKLESGKAPLEAAVSYHVEQPSPNGRAISDQRQRKMKLRKQMGRIHVLPMYSSQDQENHIGLRL
jgi:hypothetical protein